MKRLNLDSISSHAKRQELFTSLMKNNEIHVTISYISEFSNARLLRESIDDICKMYEITPKWRTRLVLIIDELNNNAIEYWSVQGEENNLELHLQRSASWNVIFSACVTDTGKWEYSKTAEEMEEIRRVHADEDFSQHDSIRGRGLFLIISHLVDSLSFKDAETGGLIVAIEKTLPLK